MKRFFFTLIFLGIGFSLGVQYPKYKGWLVSKERPSLKEVYATHPILKNHPIVVLVRAKNNALTCEKTLLSVLTQDYDNFRLIYIDEGSTDGSYEKVEEILQGCAQAKLIRGSGKNVENFYRSVHECSSQEVVLLLEGEEFLAHESVLSRINHYYANPDVWMTEAAALDYPTYAEKTPETLRTFYASLFHRIKLQDFLEEGAFKAGSEMVHTYLRQLCGQHAFITPDTLYISGASIAPFQEPEVVYYAPFTDIPTHNFIQDDEYVDIVVFSYNRPLQLYAFLESQATYVKNLHRLYVIYRADSDQYDDGYAVVKQEFPQVTYIKQSFETPFEDFAPLVHKAVFDRQVSGARYIAFALDDNIIRDPIDMKEVVSLMKETGAYGFYFRLGNHIANSPENSIPIQEGVYAWQFSSGEGEWACPNSVNMTLFKKEEIQPYFQCMKFYNPNILQALWNEHADLTQVGLYYERSKVVNLPLNVVMANEWVDEKMTNISTKELITFFDQGLKMGIAPLNQLENSAVEVEYDPQFIQR